MPIRKDVEGNLWCVMLSLLLQFVILCVCVVCAHKIKTSNLEGNGTSSKCQLALPPQLWPIQMVTLKRRRNKTFCCEQWACRECCLLVNTWDILCCWYTVLQLMWATWMATLFLVHWHMRGRRPLLMQMPVCVSLNSAAGGFSALLLLIAKCSTVSYYKPQKNDSSVESSRCQTLIKKEEEKKNEPGGFLLSVPWKLSKRAAGFCWG